MDTLRQDLRFALRTMTKKPLVTVVAVATLALAIGANTAIFTVVRTVLLRPVPLKDPQRLVTMRESAPQRGDDRAPVSIPAWHAYRDESGVFESLGGSRDWLPNLTGAGEPETISAYRFSGEFFRTLGVAPLIGRTFDEQEARPGHDRVVVLSHKLWQRRFGADPGVLGRSLTLDGASYTVIGVMPAAFRHPAMTELWVPLAPDAALAENPEPRFVRMVGRLKPGVTLEQARAAIAEVGRRLAQRYPAPQAGYQPLVEPMDARNAADVKPALLVLLGAVVFVLLIACANVSNILLARATDRQREIAIRASLGASRRRLVTQLLTESLLLALLGGALGVGLACWGVDALLGLFPKNVANLSIPRVDEIHVDGLVLAFALLLSTLTGLLFGLVPALQTSRAALAETMREGGRGGTEGRRSRRFRSSLVVAEFALALVLSAGAALLVRSFIHLRAGDLGFEPRGVTTAYVQLPRYKYDTRDKQLAFTSAVMDRVRALPGAEAAGATTFIPLSGWNTVVEIDLEGRPTPPEGRPMPEFHSVEAGYFGAMHIPLRQGRLFTADDRPGAPPVVVVNETFARRHFPGQDPLGRRVLFTVDDEIGQQSWQVVGVVGDVRHFGLSEPAPAELYVPYPQAPLRLVTLVVRGAPGLDLGEGLRQAVWSVDKDQPLLMVMPLEQLAADSITLRRLSTLLLGGLSGLALFLAALGIYGVMAHSVAQRTHEIGVRMAVGARTTDVVGLVLREGGRLAALGGALGLLAALALTRLMESLLFGVSPTDPASFAAVVAFLFACALLGCWLPARRAARVDPVIALRYE
jgi:putative ABC transport system permease protein